VLYQKTYGGILGTIFFGGAGPAHVAHRQRLGTKKIPGKRENACTKCHFVPRRPLFFCKTAPKKALFCCQYLDVISPETALAVAVEELAFVLAPFIFQWNTPNKGVHTAAASKLPPRAAQILLDA